MQWSRTVLRTALTTRRSRGIPRRIEVMSVSEIATNAIRRSSPNSAGRLFSNSSNPLKNGGCDEAGGGRSGKPRNPLDQFGGNGGVVPFVSYDKPRLPPRLFAQAKSLRILSDLDGSCHYGFVFEFLGKGVVALQFAHHQTARCVISQLVDKWMADTRHEFGWEQQETGFACKIRQRLVHGTVSVPILKRALILHRLSPIPRHPSRGIDFHDSLSLAPMRSPLGPPSSTAHQPMTKQKSQ